MIRKLLATTALAVGTVSVPAVAQQDSGFTLRGFGGISLVDGITDSYSYYGYDFELDLDLDTGFVVGAAAGFSFADFTFEGELAYRTAEFGDASVSYDGYSYSYDADGDLSAFSLLANAWYNIPLTGSLAGYVGGGAGIAQVEAEFDGYSYDSSEFAWQLGGGLKYEVSPGFTLGVGYRYFTAPEIEDSDFDFTANEVIFEVTTTF